MERNQVRSYFRNHQKGGATYSPHVKMKTIEEKNCMITKFMGATIEIESVFIPDLNESQTAYAFDVLMTPFQRGKYMEGGRFFELENVFALKYHSSWDWLMPVVIKLHDEYNVNCVRFDIDECHGAVVEFIEWYNRNK
jgi:hypothetical protein